MANPNDSDDGQPKVTVTVENQDQVDEIIRVLGEAECNGELDFAFQVERS